MRHLLLALLVCAASAAEDPVADLVSLLAADGSAERGAWAAGFHGGSAALEKDPRPFLRVVATGGGPAAVVNFNQHQPLDLAEIHGDKTLVFACEARLTADAPRGLRFGWRSDAGPSPITGAATVAPGGTWQRLVLPVTDRPAGLVARGWAVVLDGAGTLDLRSVTLGSRRDVALDPVVRDALLRGTHVAIAGRAANTATVSVVVTEVGSGRVLLERPATVRDGAFACSIVARDLPPFADCLAIARVPGRGDPAATSMPRGFYAYPARTGRHLPSLERRANLLLADGKPFACVGINYTDLHMPHCRRSDREAAAREIGRMAGWGMTAMRVTINWTMIQPAEGVFPGDPRWLEEIRAHGLNERWIEDLDYLVDAAGEQGIRSLVDLHEAPCDPYRYFAGNDPANKPGERPGNAIAWLAPDMSNRGPFDVAQPRHRTALVGVWSWLATHFKGNGNILGFEAPYNEPHEPFMVQEENWTLVTTQCTLAIEQADPTRLTFAMVGGWGHDNSAWSYSWMPPYGIDGIAPHHYLANGPVTLRADATKYDAPWNAREADPTFAYAMPAVFLPSSVHRQPVYNGEGGDWQPGIFLPQVEQREARHRMYEATLAQCYAAGVLGHFNWRVTDDQGGYDLSVFEHAKRFAPVMAEGPIDWSRADVAIIQNASAAKIENGHNFSVVPFAKAMLALHLGPVHYVTDDELVFRGIVRESKGLEQVNEASAAMGAYKAILVDPRNLDARVAEVLATSKVPRLTIADPERLDLAEVAGFLAANGVVVDQRTPGGLQVAVGPKHLVLFRREGPGGTSRIHTPLPVGGAFRLIGEDGRTVFSGTAAELVKNGAEVTVERWHSAILRIVPGAG